jgi:acetoin utilization deacetylase AcuC-like enzyme
VDSWECSVENGEKIRPKFEQNLGHPTQEIRPMTQDKQLFSVIYSDEFLEHDTGRSHPERPARLTAVVEALKAAPWASRLSWHLPTPGETAAVLSAIQRVHTPRLINEIEILAECGGGRLDMDTPVSRHSYQVALLAVSAWLNGVDRVMETGEPAFVLARPPGHHAESDRAMGFCLFSNAAIAAHYALDHQGLQRVAILDWDVHHGNGTQEIVEKNPQIAYCSLHQFPSYPGTGTASETGPHHNILNLPLAAGSTLADYQPLFEQKVMPFLREFQPDLLLVSAGYDANAADPLARIDLQPQDYGILTDYCLQLTRRIVFGLEGGYHLDALSQSVVSTIAHCLK